MAQWTLKYTTVEDPSNYITITGNVNGNSYYNIPYNIANNNIPNFYNIDITGINSSGIIFYSDYDLNYKHSFSNAFKTLYYLDNFSNTSKITNMDSIFVSCKNLVTVSNFDTSNVWRMSYMFSQCSNLINIPNFNTSKVTNMRDMFCMCYNLTTIPNFDTSNVANMNEMFLYCFDLTTIPNLDTVNVKDMNQMFSDCYRLTNIPSLNTSNVKDMGQMFDGCNNLTSVPNFDTSSVTNMQHMFSSCNKLTHQSLKNIARSLPNVSQLSTKNSNLRHIGLSQNQINYISTTKYASQLQEKGWNITYIKPDLVKSLKMKQSDGTMNLAMLGTDAEYVDMEDGTTLEETVQNLKQYIDDNVANILGGMY